MNFIVKLFKDLSIEETKSIEQNDFILDSRMHWKYSEGSIAYYKEYFGECFIDNSFIVLIGNEIAACSFIYMKNEVSFFNMPIEVFIKNKFVSKKLSSLLINFLLEISQGLKIKMYYNELLGYEIFGHKAVKITANLEYAYKLNLNQDILNIKGEFRKSYKSLVNWCLKNLNYNIMDFRNADITEFNAFREFHFKTAGGMTRSEKSWDLQRDLIIQGRAFLLNGYFNNNLVSSAYFMQGNESNYAVAVYDREMMSKNFGLAHGSIFKSVEYLKETNSNCLNLGFWESQNQLSEKEEQILIFKRGFTNFLEIRNILGINLD